MCSIENNIGLIKGFQEYHDLTYANRCKILTSTNHSPSPLSTKEANSNSGKMVL